MTIDNHGDQILHSLHGRKFGLDHIGNLTGFPDIRSGTERTTSSVSSTLAPSGTSLLAAATTGVYELVPPSAAMIGVRKRLVNASSAAVAMYAKLTSGFFLVNGSTANATVSLTTRGANVELEYISTLYVAAIGINSTAGFAQFSATT